MYTLIFICALFTASNADLDYILQDIIKKEDLEYVIGDLLDGIARQNDGTCVAILCDTVYLNLIEGALFRKVHTESFVLIVVSENEDLLSPNYRTLQALRRAKKDGCGVYVIILANGIQAGRLLRFGDRHRIIDTRSKYVMLHDHRLFENKLRYLWKRIVNVVFLRHHSNPVKNITLYDLSTVPFPYPIEEGFITRRINVWRNGKFQYNRNLFADKTNNLNGEILNVVYIEHMPSVVITEDIETNKVGGVEMEILNTLASKMNFRTKLYQPDNSKASKWGQRQANGSFNGLLGEVVAGKADIAVGNLQYTPYYHELMDLSMPYTAQCWTFLTPEAATDNSWKTLVLPFKLYLWIAVLLVLLVTGSIFFGLAKYYMHLMAYRNQIVAEKSLAMQKKEQHLDARPLGLYLFGEITNSILYTYGMLLVVSLPRLPSGWSIRLLTGWYWLYCILLVVSYRASMTAILAKPTPRVTIDTLKELADSKLKCGGWDLETRRFFERSLGDVGQKLGERFEVINDPDEATTRIIRGDLAYYDSKNFLKHLSFKGNIDNETSTSKGTVQLRARDRNLHIMSECVVNIPTSIGFHRNSPLKPLADVYLRRIVEVGLVQKWLNDIMYKINSAEGKDEEIKALMNLKKLHGAFIALAIGYSVSALCLLGEFMHWEFVVKRDPQFDIYSIDLYYRNKKL